MMITIPRYFAVGLAGFFSAYHVILAFSSIDTPRSPWPIWFAIALYVAATVASLWPWKHPRMPLWIASFSLSVSIAIPLLVTSQLDPNLSNGYATWYVAAVGTLLAITMVRRRPVFAWVGIGALTLQSILWAGPGALTSLGVVGSFSWVLVSSVLMQGLTRAGRETRQFGEAEREAAQWLAAQEAHLYERQIRLLQTSRMAAPMLNLIVAKNGELTEEERRECFTLEAAIRDEIRGRKLLNDAVRHEVMRARRAGTIVTLLDEGGIDDLDSVSLEKVHDLLAKALRATTTDKFIIRTVPEGSATAVTVVGLREQPESGGYDDDDNEIDLWLEIPRVAADAPVAEPAAH